jgi:hypothetical protein
MVRKLFVVMVMLSVVPLLAAADWGRWRSTAAAQSCPGDLNGDKQVTVDEVLTALNSALHGCPEGPTPTPTRSVVATQTPTPAPVTGCALRFDEDYGGGSTCYFVGRVNPSCGSQGIVMSFTTLGFLGVFVIITPPGASCFQGQCFTFLATPTGPRTATLTNWSNSIQDPYFQHTLSGDLTLSADGEAIDLRPDGSPFSVSGCPFVEYQGTHRPL